MQGMSPTSLPTNMLSQPAEISSKNHRSFAAERSLDGVPIKSQIMRSTQVEPIIAVKEASSAPWADLSIFNRVLDLLTDPKDLVACASVCKAWGAEVASSEHLFKEAWVREVSDQGLWRWAHAAGGYRGQLRANSVVRKGPILTQKYQFSIFF
jgi:hypothetical protein